MRYETVLFLAVLLLSCAADPYRDGVVTLRDHSIRVELATTPDEQAQGLMHKTALPTDAGMLFVFNESKTRTFWMKNMKIPLDILFLDDNGKIVTIYRRVPPCTQTPCELYSSVVPILYALEVRAGEADTVKEGETAPISYMG